MINPYIKCKILVQHAAPSIIGVFKLFCQRPWFCIKLLALRTVFFFTNRLAFQLTTPDKYTILQTNELIWYWSIFVEQELWHPSWINAIKKEHNPVILDVGANAGLFSHLMFFLNKTSRVIAFEPLPVMAQRISDMAKKNGFDITVINKAVSDECGKASFYFSADNDVCASLAPHPESTRSTQVTVTTLDNELAEEKIFLAKIDVEGLECAVISGAQNTISKTRFLLMEALSSDALVDMKNKLGNDWTCHKVGASDYFFERRNS